MLPSPAHDPDLIAAFYAAAAHTDQWNGAWSALCHAFEADTGLLYRQDRPSEAPQVLAARNWPAASEHYFHLDPAWQSGQGSGVRTAMGEEIVAPRFAGLAAFDVAAQTPGVAYHVLCATAKLDDVGLVGMGLHRPVNAPRFTETDRQALDGVGRHVASALRLQAMLAAERSASAIRGSALDLYPHGMAIATATGALVFANRAARRIATASQMTLGLGRACLGQLKPEEATRVEALVTSVGGGGPGGCVRVVRDHGMPMLAVMVEPLPVRLADQACLDQADTGGNEQTYVLLTLRDLGATTDASPSHLMDLFGLTAAEAGIVPQLLIGDSASLIAQSRGVAVSTVKAQASKVLAKTGAANLRALASMIAALGCG